MPDNTENTNAQNTPDAVVNNTGANKEDSGAGTQPAKQEPQFQPFHTEKTEKTEETITTEAAQPKEKTFTQADLDRIVKDRLAKAVKSELKKLTGETDGQPTVDDLQRQLADTQTKARTLEAREQVRDYLTDPRNKIYARQENMRVIEKLIFTELEFDDEGNPSNLKEAIAGVKSEAPTLFLNSNSSINGNSGRSSDQVPFNWNDEIRAAAGYRTR